jgi:hypothetical protein
VRRHQVRVNLNGLEQQCDSGIVLSGLQRQDGQQLHNHDVVRCRRKKSLVPCLRLGESPGLVMREGCRQRFGRCVLRGLHNAKIVDNPMRCC